MPRLFLFFFSSVFSWVLFFKPSYKKMGCLRTAGFGWSPSKSLQWSQMTSFRKKARKMLISRNCMNASLQIWGPSNLSPSKQNIQSNRVFCHFPKPHIFTQSGKSPPIFDGNPTFAGFVAPSLLRGSCPSLVWAQSNPGIQPPVELLKILKTQNSFSAWKGVQKQKHDGDLKFIYQDRIFMNILTCLLQNTTSWNLKH